MFSKLLMALMILLAICCVFWVVDIVIKEEKRTKTPECEYKLWEINHE